MQGQPNLWHPHQQSHTLQDGAKPFLKRRGQSGQGGGTNTGNYSQSHPHHQNPNFRQGRMPQPPSVATLQLSASNGYRNNVRQHTSIVQDSTDSRTIRNDGSDASQHHSRNKHSKQGTTGSTGGNYTDGVHVVGEKGRKPAAIAAPPMASPTYFPPLADGSALTPSSPIDKDMVSETVASKQTVTHAETPIASDTKKVMTGYAAALLRPAPPTPPSPPRENDTPTQNKKQSAAKAITQKTNGATQSQLSGKKQLKKAISDDSLPTQIRPIERKDRNKGVTGMKRSTEAPPISPSPPQKLEETSQVVKASVPKWGAKKSFADILKSS